MARHGRNYQTAVRKTRRATLPPEQAIVAAKAAAFAKFDESVEIHIRTNADPRHADQQFREVTTLPHGTGKQMRVFVFAEGEAAEIARNAGADYIANDELIKQIESGWSDFEVAVATPDQMGKIGRLGRFLGRKGLMPNPRTGTVVQAQDIPNAISEAKRGRVELRMDRTAIIHAAIGKKSFEDAQLLENLMSVMTTVNQGRPSGVKGTFVRSVSLCTTMGPGVNLDLPTVQGANA